MAVDRSCGSLDERLAGYSASGPSHRAATPGSYQQVTLTLAPKRRGPPPLSEPGVKKLWPSLHPGTPAMKFHQPQRPMNRGGRFSMNAVRPSL